ncbi:hypothetical protein [Streptomyces sp. NPDC049590]|uniref:hypothetical protein n=1 Tax=Streptomyces sp. NPDC049590 TaxID=3154834 RepID=UPI003436140B
MRDLPARRLASTVLCAAVLAGLTGPVAFAADAAGEHGRTASRASVPASSLPATAKEDLLAQVRALGRAHPGLSPVVDLFGRSLEEGRLPADEARRLGEAAKEAITRTAAAQSATAVTIASPAAPVTTRQAHAGAPVARDALDDALDALRTALDNLVKAITGAAGTTEAATAADASTATDTATATDAATTDDSDQLLPVGDDLLSGLLDLLTGLFGLGGSRIAATDLPAAATPAG